MVDPQTHWQQSPISPTAVRCVTCGYDLTGAAVGGHCSECGTPVTDSLRPLQTEQHSSTATTSMVLGILSLLLCAVIGPFAIASALSARREMERGHFSKGSHTMAKAGLVMGIISTCILGFWILVLLFAGI